MTNALMIYGAAGYTGRMAAAQAKALGLEPILAGRDEQVLAELAWESGLSYRVFPLDNPIWHASGAPNIETFVQVSGTAFSTGEHSALRDSPDTEECDANRYQASVVVTGVDGESVRSLLDTVNGYSFTPMAATEAARRVLLGDARPGFQVPAKHFGAGFAETTADTRIKDIHS